MADGEAATAKAAAPPDDYERDTDAAQETDAMALCMQPAEGHGDAMPPQGATHFGLAFSSRVFAGWVKQSSPACAAGEQPTPGRPAGVGAAATHSGLELIRTLGPSRVTDAPDA